MLIYICCCGGATSSLFCLKIMKDTVEESIYVNDLASIASQYEKIRKEYDMILAYGPTEFLTIRNIREYGLDKILDLVMICPQARYLQGSIEKLLNPFNIDVNVIDMKTFGRMHGKKALLDIQDILTRDM